MDLHFSRLISVSALLSICVAGSGCVGSATFTAADAKRLLSAPDGAEIDSEELVRTLLWYVTHDEMGSTVAHDPYQDWPEQLQKSLQALGSDASRAPLHLILFDPCWPLPTGTLVRDGSHTAMVHRTREDFRRWAEAEAKRASPIAQSGWVALFVSCRSAESLSISRERVVRSAGGDGVEIHDTGHGSYYHFAIARRDAAELPRYLLIYRRMYMS